MSKKITALACALLLSSCSSVDSTKVFDQQQAANMLKQNHTMKPTRQMVKVSIPEKNQWKPIDMSLGTVGTPIMLIPSNESAHDWTQSVRTQILAYNRDPNATPQGLAETQIADAKKICKRASGEVTSHTTQHAFYRIDMRDCFEAKNQIQVGKAIAGDDAIYLVYYTAINHEVSSTQINRMTNAIDQAKLLDVHAVKKTMHQG